MHFSLGQHIDYIILFISESFMNFSMLYDYVICNCDIYNHSITGIILLSLFMICVTITYDITSYPLSKSKIK